MYPSQATPVTLGLYPITHPVNDIFPLEELFEYTDVPLIYQVIVDPDLTIEWWTQLFNAGYVENGAAVVLANKVDPGIPQFRLQAVAPKYKHTLVLGADAESPIEKTTFPFWYVTR